MKKPGSRILGLCCFLVLAFPLAAQSTAVLTNPGNAVKPVTFTERLSDTWSKGWTNLGIYNIGTTLENAKTFIFVHKEKEGTTHVSQLAPNFRIGKRIYDEDWSAGWATIEVINAGAFKGFYHAKDGTGLERAAAFKPGDGTYKGNVGEINQKFAMTHAVSYSSGQEVYVFAYQKSDGYIEGRRVRDSTNSPFIRSDFATKIKPNLKGLEMIKRGNTWYLLGLDSSRHLWFYEVGSPDTGSDKAGKLVREAGVLEMGTNVDRIAVWADTYLLTLDQNADELKVWEIADAARGLSYPVTLSLAGLTDIGIEADSMEPFSVIDAANSTSYQGVVFVDSRSGSMKLIQVKYPITN